MDRPENQYQIHFPRSMPELALLLEENSDYCFYWGVPIKSASMDRLHFPFSRIISLQYLDELKRISRSDRYIEAGSTITLQELLDKANKILPLPFLELVKENVPLPYRNQITLGGLIEQPMPFDKGMSLLFNLLDILVEVRSRKSKRKRSSLKPVWYYYNQYQEKETFKGDILSTFRIPLTRWDQYLLVPIRFSQGILYMAVLTDISRGYISDFRMGFQYGNLPIIRNREWEANIMGRKGFFSAKEKENIYETLVEMGVPSDDIYLKPALMHNLNNLLYHFQDSGY